MPPRRKSKAIAEVSTPKASATPVHDEDAMDIDTPKASETPRTTDTPVTTKPNHPPESEVLGDLWTEDQISSLFKAIMRWKPSGMHKHFRVIAISEHLRNHGFDPDVETHTRIPGIWTKLRQFFDMEMIDERDNSFDYVRSLGGDEAPEQIYKNFDLPPNAFHDLMWARAAATEDEPDNWSDSQDGAPAAATATKKQQPPRKRKRGDTSATATATATDAASIAGSATARTTRRSSTVDDTDRETPVVSSPVGRSARGVRSQKRAAAKAKTESVKSNKSEHDEEEEKKEEEQVEEEKEEEEDDDDENDSDEDEDAGEQEEESSANSSSSSSGSSSKEEEEEEKETEAPATRSGRGGAARGGRGGGRGRGRPKGTRKKN